MIVRLYDGWNYFRVCVESDMTSLTPRRLYQDMVRSPSVLHVWCWDGKGAREARQKIFPAYKAKRKPPADDIYASIMNFRELLKHSTAYQIEMAGYEADDIIAALVDHYAPTSERVEILSNDFDLMALTAGRANVICGAKAKDGVKPEDIHVYKTFKGDPSDNIPGVPLFGPKCWEAADKKVLRSIAESSLEGKVDDRLLKLMFRDEVRGMGSIQNWIRQNPEDLARMYVITGFMPPSVAEITSAIYRPIHDPRRVEAMFREFLL